MFAKSLQYCSGVTQDGDERCFMLLCEVALGTSQETSMDGTSISDEALNPEEHQSRKAHGHTIPDPQHTITRDDGLF